MTDRKYQYSEIFFSIQGEGFYTGVPTVWFRSWGCNFSCEGFNQKNPLDPSTWKLEYLDVDPTQYNRLEDLPVFEHGCDSSYSWSRKFSCLAHKETAEEISQKIRSLLPEGKFKHPKSGLDYHMAFTGGEPMMAQTAIVDIMETFAKQGNIPKYVTVETNGTQLPRDNFVEFIKNGFFKVDKVLEHSEGLLPLPDEEKITQGKEWFWSISPKLYLSGEKWEDAIRPEVVKAYYELSPKGQLKYVVNNTQRAWDEVERATELYREQGIDFPVWIMPVGATLEEQEDIQKAVCEETLKRGYNFSARLHCFVFGNTIGT